jgi:hypothetical protein
VSAGHEGAAGGGGERESAALRVIVCDDQPIVREGVAQILRRLRRGGDRRRGV